MSLACDRVRQPEARHGLRGQKALCNVNDEAGKASGECYQQTGPKRTRLRPCPKKILLSHIFKAVGETLKPDGGAIVHQPYDFVAIFVLAFFGLNETKVEAGVLYTVPSAPPI